MKLFGGNALNFLGPNLSLPDVPSVTLQPKLPTFLLSYQDKKKPNIFPEGGQAAEIPPPPPPPEAPLFDPLLDLPAGAPPEVVEEFFANLPLPPLPLWVQQQQQLQQQQEELAAAAAHQEVQDFFANLPLPPIPEWAQQQQQQQEQLAQQQQQLEQQQDQVGPQGDHPDEPQQPQQE